METQQGDQTANDKSVPGIATALFIVGVLDIFGGVIMFVVTLAVSASQYTYGQFSIYSGIMWLVGGIVSGLLMIAVGSALEYLHGIHQESVTSTGLLRQLLDDARRQD